MIRKENGITLIALMITVVVLLILASLTIQLGKGSISESKEDVAIAELKQVQTAVMQRKMSSEITGEETLRDEITVSTLPTTIQDLLQQNSGYYELNTDDLKTLGISNTTDTYIVNYDTGEVINKTKADEEDFDINYVYLKGIE